MAQADGVVANGTGSAVRSDINTQYAALWSNHSGSTEPSSGKVAYQLWADTNSGYLKIRNSANNAWIQLFKLDGTDLADICRLTGSTNNTITTVTGANAIQGEANLTFDGSSLGITGTTKITGNTSIGTTTQNWRFQVLGGRSTFTDTTSYALGVRKNSTQGSGYNYWIGGAAADDTTVPDLVFSNNAGTERFRVTDAGRVGIGTTLPQNKLDVRDSHVNISEGYGITWHSGSDDCSGQIYADSSDNIVFRNTSSRTERVRIQSGGGISFNGNTAVANAIDDYEDGTWIPTLNSGLTANSSYNTWSYTKIGRQVTIRGLFLCSSVSGTNDITIGLPFASANLTQNANAGGACNMFRRINHTAAGLAALVANNSSELKFYGLGEGTGDWTRITNDDIDTATEVYVVHTYFAA